MPDQHILFVTGRLAERPLRRIVERIAASAGFMPEVAVLGTLSKSYQQDEPLQWGFLTRPETSAVHWHAGSQTSPGNGTTE
jgi:hypothetical protein